MWGAATFTFTFTFTFTGASWLEAKIPAKDIADNLPLDPVSMTSWPPCAVVLIPDGRRNRSLDVCGLSAIRAPPVTSQDVDMPFLKPGVKRRFISTYPSIASVAGHVERAGIMCALFLMNWL
jgi:hypothetical protein